MSYVRTFYAISDGEKRIYTYNDGVEGYRRSLLLNPNNMTYINLFINGILQPESHFRIKKGKLLLNVDPIPDAGVPIIVQFIQIRPSSRRMSKKRLAKQPQSLIKPHVRGKSTAPIASNEEATTTIRPDIRKLYAILSGEMIGSLNTIIPATSFIEEGIIVAKLPPIPSNGYVNVSINGILQADNLYSLSEDRFTLHSTEIYGGMPITLEFIEFSNMTTIKIQPTISPPDIIIFT
ncbi:protein of unknown function [Thermoactinomyces sp. DSM 45891]|nr:protein of unknown function [Thermoactinomyces sp. DSM 45891]